MDWGGNGQVFLEEEEFKKKYKGQSLRFIQKNEKTSLVGRRFELGKEKEGIDVKDIFKSTKED